MTNVLKINIDMTVTTASGAALQIPTGARLVLNDARMLVTPGHGHVEVTGWIEIGGVSVEEMLRISGTVGA